MSFVTLKTTNGNQIVINTDAIRYYSGGTGGGKPVTEIHFSRKHSIVVDGPIGEVTIKLLGG